MSPFGTIPARTVKRRIYAPPQRAVAGAGPGFTQETETELRLLLDGRITPSHFNPTITASHGNIYIRSIDYRSLLEVVLRSSCATDIGMIVGRGTALGEKELASLLGTVEWRLFFPPSGPCRVRIRAEARASRLFHTGLLGDALAEALASVGGAEVAQGEEADHLITLRNSHNRVQVILSLCGAPLWQRGYRSSLSAVAPLREDLAQAAIRRSLRWAGALPPSPRAAGSGFDSILVPFSGTGTLAFESIIAMCDVPPFLFRSGFDGETAAGYAFERFAFGIPPSVTWLKRQLLERLRDRFAVQSPTQICMVDSYDPACESARENWRHFSERLSAAITSVGAGDRNTEGPSLPFDTTVLHEDSLLHEWIHYLPVGAERVFIPLNPPYGRRVRSTESASLYQRIGRRLEQLVSRPRPAAAAVQSAPARSRRLHVTGLILCPEEAAWRAFMRAAPSFSFDTSHFMQGGLDIRLCLFRS
ncbi:hypothetical protein [Salinispira pacifica]